MNASFRRAFTVIEILFSLALASVVLLVVTVIVSRSQVVFQLGNELVDAQSLLGNSITILTADFKSMTRFIGLKDGVEIEFEVFGNHGKETVKYRFDKADKSLKRESDKSFSTDFKSKGMIEYLNFSTVFSSALPAEKADSYNSSAGIPDHVNLVMYLVSTENDRMQAKVRLPIIVQFYSEGFKKNKFIK
ncbi:MAG: hypothetical protein HQM10_23370 [Candidatus Riflebacteria bacterium]|nr:hypothetical protein [Candidatus Riflebacteria bacterium]